MFVLIGLISYCLRRLVALMFGMDRTMTPARRAIDAQQLTAYSQQHPLAPVHAPTPRLTI